MNNFILTTPVALITFNRPSVTKRVFDEIAKAKPQKLLLISDGPRDGHAEDVEKVAETRKIVSQVNWDCEVFTNFSNENLGCKMRPKTGIDWVFDQVEEAIILEDDCLPHPIFFRFCQELLTKYRQDQRVSMISGLNLQPSIYNFVESYYFSRYLGTWGWATWRDRWLESYDIDMLSWPTIRDSGWLDSYLENSEEAKYWTRVFELVYTGEISTAWDYQWLFACWVQNRLGIVPKANLISNIGFGTDATHTLQVSSRLANMPTEDIDFPIVHPKCITRNHIFDRVLFSQVYNARLTWQQLTIQRFFRLLRIIK